MGLDASVMCNCFARGSCKPPPIPAEHLKIDEDGYLNPPAEYDTEKYWNPYYIWKQTCCDHPGMNFACERISNWAGYRLFQEALETVGWENFPVLVKELPSGNGGKTSPSEATRALKELEFFRNLEVVARNTALVDVRTGYVRFEYVAAYEGVFIYGDRSASGAEAGIGEFEFFVRDKETKTDLFRAARFEQTFLDAQVENRAYDGRVQLSDLDSGAIYVGTIAVSGDFIPWPDGRMQDNEGRYRSDYPKEFRVDVREVGPSHFAYAVEPLMRVFQASVTTGNPVRWC